MEFNTNKTYFNFLRGGRIIVYIIVVWPAPMPAVTLATTRATVGKRIATTTKVPIDEDTGSTQHATPRASLM